MGEKCYKVPFLERFKITLFTTYKCTLYDDVGLACPALIIVWKNKTECRVHCKADQFLRGNGHQLPSSKLVWKRIGWCRQQNTTKICPLRSFTHSYWIPKLQTSRKDTCVLIFQLLIVFTEDDWFCSCLECNLKLKASMYLCVCMFGVTGKWSV